MPRIVDHDKRKREIARSALMLFSKQGYHESSFSDIASACRLSRSNIYNYFKNKDEIFHYAVVELLNSITQNIELIAHQDSLTLAQKLQRIYQLFTNDFGDGKNASIILDLSLRLKRKDTKLVATLDNSAVNLRKNIENLFVSENANLPYVQIAVVTTLFFSLIESSITHSLFTEKAFIQQNIAVILQMLGI
ncbi:MAG TPA: TetR/AcrR family transcriptional regulator [Rectinema sp.]|jgi:AcrR family transcriptional regulator|nr:TetR/AcrR family transcriptional regulator [Spirochaetia bacterium]MDI9428238.1 TetR/AcrR family transcriptional regulator [Spirochaetota bacterium]NLH89078.1 TetR/AcrR family transcriptional regulator [Treponema sp.]OQC74606.1 MAG: DNA-binding transcriptional repressor AcrR [Spirochaetes bacterium ADurb.Bin001]HOC27204.1 TetR/AcrR family transcriptional regulator [Rectinema sp.]